MRLQQNPDPESRIQQAMNLLTKLNKDLLRITKTIHDQEADERAAYYQLDSLEYRKNGLRNWWSNEWNKMAALKRDLDKLTFANNAYKEKSISTQDKLNLHNLYFRMHHGTDNMAKENKVLKEVNASRKRLNNDRDSGPSVVEEINDQVTTFEPSIRRSVCVSSFIPRPAVMVDEKQVLEEINELKWARDKAFASAPVKGKIWNSLPPKNVIKQQIKEMEEALDDEYRKDHMQLRCEIQAAKRRINGVKKNIASLNRQLLAVGRKKGAAYKEVIRLIKIQNKHV
ncbi:uncharacterized protein LOC120128355 [Hibiscus syriacus]|uniref:uncharacterized protein LOC120128355 n=1 Tax=Hibiscus syriacus TaxID=106335 RepID=UPI0019237BA4|nr:uncharacterized protein LOC120128355 [Hibiscus syriacus]